MKNVNSYTGHHKKKISDLLANNGGALIIRLTYMYVEKIVDGLIVLGDKDIYIEVDGVKYTSPTDMAKGLKKYYRNESNGANTEGGNAADNLFGNFDILGNVYLVDLGISLGEYLDSLATDITEGYDISKNKLPKENVKNKPQVKKDKTPKYLFNMMREISGRGIYNEKFLQLNGIAHSNVITMLKNKGIVNKKQYESYMINTTLMQFCNDMGIQHTEVKVA